MDVAGDGTTRPIRVRLTGINTMELTRYADDPRNWRGDCHAVEAARRMYSLVYGKTVRLTAQDSRSMSGVRYRRRVWVYTGGAWRDVALIMLAEGQGLFLPNATEYAPNKAATAAAEDAARRGIGLWDTDACGSGPVQKADVRVDVAWDAPGDDAANPDGDTSRSPTTPPAPSTCPAGGSGTRRRAVYKQHGYVFPRGTRVPAGGAVRVHPGSGRNTATDLYWGLGIPIFENATGAPTYMGDGGYLFDPQGDLRAWQQYTWRDQVLGRR